MRSYFYNLWTDESRFVSLGRFLLGGAGAAVIAQPEILSGLPPWLGAIGVAIAMGLSSSPATSSSVPAKPIGS